MAFGNLEDRETSGDTDHNVDKYERGKVLTAIGDLEAAARTLRNYLALADELEQQGVRVTKAPEDELAKLTYPNHPAGDGSDLRKILSMGRRAQERAAKAAQAAGVSLDDLRAKLAKRLSDQLPT